MSNRDEERIDAEAEFIAENAPEPELVPWIKELEEQIAELKRRDYVNERRLNEFRKEFYRLQSAVASMKEGKR